MSRDGYHRQRSQLPANRELVRALRAPRPSARGIRRPLDIEDRYDLLEAWPPLHGDGTAPETLIPRARPGLTLFPLKRLSAHMSQGLVNGQHIAKSFADFEHDPSLQCHRKSAEITLGDIACYRGFTIYVEVISPAVDAERQRMIELLRHNNVQAPGMIKILEQPLHMTLADADERIGRRTEEAIITSLREVPALAPGNAMTVNEWQIYPDVRPPVPYDELPQAG